MNFEKLSASRTSARDRRIDRDARTQGPTRPIGPGGAAAIVIRGLDLLGSGLLLAVLALPMLLVAMLIRLTSRGPALFRQERVGLGGRTFTMYKFRTMRVDAEASGTPVWARRGDPRRTLLGIVLRRWSVDELPQLLNVLRGEMSLVGPRPERPYFVEQFSRTIPAYNQRHQVLPGITGWAQINGWRGDSSITERLNCDLYYINHRSVWFYARVLLLTLPRLLIERNAC